MGSLQSVFKSACRFVLLLIAVCISLPALADTVKDAVKDTVNESSADQWLFNISPFTQHYHPKPEHKYVWLVGIEKESTDKSLMGLAYFSNSFGQDCVYIYPWGQRYPNLWGYERLTGKWSAGVIYGYTGQYENKVPLNYKGYSVGVIPGLSWRLDGGNELQMNLVGGAGFMFQASFPISVR